VPTTLADRNSQLIQTCLRARPGVRPVLLIGLGLLPVIALLYPAPIWLPLMTAALALCTIGAVISVVCTVHDRQNLRFFDVVQRMMAAEHVPAFSTDAEGVVLWRNLEARTKFGEDTGVLLSQLLSGFVADPQKLLADLRERARQNGHARDQRRTRNGTLTLSVLTGRPGMYFWRVEEVRNTGEQAMDAIGLPMLRLGSSGRLRDANRALRDLVGAEITRLEDVVADPPLLQGRLHQVNTPDGPQPRQVLILSGETQREIYFLPAGTGGAEEQTQLLETLPVPLIKLSAAGAILMANRGARELLEDRIEPGRLLQELVSGLGRSVADWLREAAEGRGLNRSEFLQVVNPTKEVFVQVTLKRLPQDADADLVAVLTDATELKTLEAQFVQSQKMQAIGQLAGGVAHDFNNLLTAISGHCDLLLLRHDQGDPEYGDLVQIHQNANRAASLVGQLLAFSRKQTLQPEIVDLRDALSDLTHLLNRLVGEKIRLVLNHDPALSPIRADRRQLEQVIMNLVVNARDAMPGGGDITIETQAQNLSQEMKRNRASIPPGEYSVIKVVDHGIGIPPDKLSKVFEPFYTTKRTGEGTGLGLSTAYGIVKQTGGFIFVDSEEGVGTTFILYFPAYTRSLPQAEAPLADNREPDRTAQGEGVILLVEDEAPVRAFASRALRMRGYTVLEAESAEEALEKLSDPELEVDLFVTDVVMPGLDGPSWVRQALQDRPETRVVFVSGYAEDALADHKNRIPNSVFLPKPFSLKELTGTVQAQLAERA